MLRMQSGWVFNPEEESRVLEADVSEAMMLRAAAHTRSCCLSGHRCRRGDSCRRRCLSCHQDAMAAWDGKKHELSRQADAWLTARDGIPVLMPQKDQATLVKEVLEVVVKALIDLGYTF